MRNKKHPVCYHYEDDGKNLVSDDGSTRMSSSEYEIKKLTSIVLETFNKTGMSFKTLECNINSFIHSYAFAELGGLKK